MTSRTSKAGFFGGWTVTSNVISSPMVSPTENVPNQVNHALLSAQSDKSSPTENVTFENLQSLSNKVNQTYEYGVREFIFGLPTDRITSFTVTDAMAEELLRVVPLEAAKVYEPERLLLEGNVDVKEGTTEDALEAFNTANALTEDALEDYNNAEENSDEAATLLESYNGLQAIEAGKEHAYNAYKALSEPLREELNTLDTFINGITCTILHASFSFSDPAYLVYEYMHNKYGVIYESGILLDTAYPGTTTTVTEYGISATEIIEATLVRTDNTTGDILATFIEQIAFEEFAKIFHVMYVVDQEPNGEVEYFMYNTADKAYPILSPEVDTQVNNSFYPIVPIRTNDKFFSEYSSYEDVENINGLLRFLNTSLNDIEEALSENPDLDSIDDVFLVQAVPVNSFRPNTIRYLMEYFKALAIAHSLDTSETDTTYHWLNPIEGTGSGHSLHIEQGQFNITLKFNSLVVKTVTGVKGIKGFTDSVINVSTPSIEYIHQVSDTTYESVVVTGLTVGSTLWSRKNHHVYQTLHDVTDGFVIPISHSVLLSMEYWDRIEVYYDSLRLILYTISEEHVSFWKSEAFNIFIFIIIIIILIVLIIISAIIPGLQVLIPFLVKALISAIIAFVVVVVLAILKAILLTFVPEDIVGYIFLVLNVVTVIFTWNIDQIILTIMSVVATALTLTGQIMSAVADSLIEDLIEDQSNFLKDVWEMDEELYLARSTLHDGFNPFNPLLIDERERELHLSADQWLTKHMPREINKAGLFKDFTSNYVDAALRLPERKEINVA